MNHKQEELFNHAYQNYANMLLKIIKTYIKDEGECEDVLQEVFFTLLVKTPKFESQEYEKRWLIRVAINKSKDYHRSFWKRMVKITEKDIPQESSTSENYLNECIESLPDVYKEVVLLHYYFGYSIKEIASILNLGESAVKMRLSRARMKLQTEMEKNYE